MSVSRGKKELDTLRSKIEVKNEELEQLMVKMERVKEEDLLPSILLHKQLINNYSELAAKIEAAQLTYCSKILSKRHDASQLNSSVFKLVVSSLTLPSLEAELEYKRDLFRFQLRPQNFHQKLDDLKSSINLTENEISSQQFELHQKKTSLLKTPQSFKGNMDLFINSLLFCNNNLPGPKPPQTSYNIDCLKTRAFVIESYLDDLVQDCMRPELVDFGKEKKVSQYAACVDIILLAERILAETPPESRPYSEIIYCNIGDPQSVGQPGITFFREVLNLYADPSLLDREPGQFRVDVIRRATQIRSQIPEHLTRVVDSNSQEIKGLRDTIADGIADRDGFPANPNDIFMTDGACPAVYMMMQLLLGSKNDGILCPVPHCPLFSTSIALKCGTLIPYFLDEAASWQIDITHLRKQLNAAKSQGIHVKALIVINPGNPTGQVLEQSDQCEIVQFCKKHKLVLLADEVYQENVYVSDKKFHSFKKVSRGMKCDIELVSFHSTSKGYYGDCGTRGGFMEVTGFSSEIKEHISNLASVKLSANISGQILASLVMSPPKVGDESYDSYVEERDRILSSLATRAKTLEDAFNSLKGVQCNRAEGAMHLFPSIVFSKKAIAIAKALEIAPDVYYCQNLLKQTGIVVLPGSGFRQVPGTWHLMCTILPQEEMIQDMVKRLRDFHNKFVRITCA